MQDYPVPEKPPAARFVTIVAPISRDGMMRQHARGRLSQANSPWERLMPFEKQLRGGPSRFLLAGHREARTRSRSPILILSKTSPAFAGRSAALRPHLRSFHEIDLRGGEDYRSSLGASIRSGSARDPSRRAIPSAMRELGARAAAGFAAFGEIVFFGIFARIPVLDHGAGARGLRDLRQGDVSLPCRGRSRLAGRPGQSGGCCGSRSTVGPAPRDRRGASSRRSSAARYRNLQM